MIFLFLCMAYAEPRESPAPSELLVAEDGLHAQLARLLPDERRAVRPMEDAELVLLEGAPTEQ